MSKKDLTRYSGDVMPALAGYYISANEKTFSTRPIVHISQWGIFRVLEDDLRDLHVPIRDYAYTTIAMLKKWALSHKMRYVPIKSFSSDWALAKFLKVWQSQTVEIHPDDADADLLYSELLVARAFIRENLQHYTRLSKVVEACMSLVSKEWYELYDSKDKRRSKFVNKAIEMLCDDYNLNIIATSYNDILHELMK